MTVHVNSLANLRPWTKEHAPKGRPKGTIYPAEWVKRMTDLSAIELREIAADEGESISKRAAAKMLLDAIDDDAEVRRRTTTEVMDRTTGKAQQHINVQGDGAQPTLVQIIDGKAPRAKTIDSTSPDAKLLADKTDKTTTGESADD